MKKCRLHLTKIGDPEYSIVLGYEPFAKKFYTIGYGATKSYDATVSSNKPIGPHLRLLWRTWCVNTYLNRKGRVRVRWFLDVGPGFPKGNYMMKLSVVDMAGETSVKQCGVFRNR